MERKFNFIERLCNRRAIVHRVGCSDTNVRMLTSGCRALSAKWHLTKFDGDLTVMRHLIEEATALLSGMKCRMTGTP